MTSVTQFTDCKAADCDERPTMPSGFCSKRCYHRQYARDHAVETGLKQRQRYATDAEYRQTLKRRQQSYYATEAGQESLRRRHERHAAENPDYHEQYAVEHSAEAVERARKWNLNHPEEARRHSRIKEQRRRARKLDQFIEDVDPNVVYKMHGGMCGICKEFIQGDFHVDHVMPLSRGGVHGYINVQPAHPQCNMRKGAKLS